MQAAERPTGIDELFMNAAQPAHRCGTRWVKLDAWKLAELQSASGCRRGVGDHEPRVRTMRTAQGAAQQRARGCAEYADVTLSLIHI